MSAESLFHDLLGLGAHWRVTELTHLPGAHSEVRIVIEATDGLYESYRCPEDGAAVRAYDHAPLRKWRHLNPDYALARSIGITNCSIFLTMASIHPRFF
jgi:hypothetical protein